MNRLTFNNEIVVTTAVLAKALGVDERRIKQNFGNNKGRYVAGKHYFLVTGTDLQAIKRGVEIFDFVKIPPNVNQLYLWTERGALNHVKSLGTDEAWDAFENLVDSYFQIKELSQSPQPDTALLEFTRRPKQIENSKEVNTRNFEEGGKELIIEYNRKNCLFHTGFTPGQIVEYAKKAGMPAKMRTSAKEVLRNTNPPIACSMALADDFCKTGKMAIDDAASFCRENALPVFAKMAELGMLPAGHDNRGLSKNLQ